MLPFTTAASHASTEITENIQSTVLTPTVLCFVQYFYRIFNPLVTLESVGSCPNQQRHLQAQKLAIALL